MAWLQRNYQVVGWIPFALYAGGELLSQALLWLASFPVGATLALTGAPVLYQLARSGKPVAWPAVAVMMSLSPFILVTISTLLEPGIPTPD